MDEFDIPIFKKNYELYKSLNSIRALVPKQDRYVVWQRVENTNLDVTELILHATALYKTEKLPVLDQASVKLNLLRFLIRLSYDTKAIDGKKYTAIQQQIDEIGRMLGGWIKSLKVEGTQNAPLQGASQ